MQTVDCFQFITVHGQSKWQIVQFLMRAACKIVTFSNSSIKWIKIYSDCKMSLATSDVICLLERDVTNFGMSLIKGKWEKTWSTWEVLAKNWNIRTHFRCLLGLFLNTTVKTITCPNRLTYALHSLCSWRILRMFFEMPPVMIYTFTYTYTVHVHTHTILSSQAWEHWKFTVDNYQFS